MYSIKNVKKEDLSKIKVKHQKEIIQATKRKFDPIEAFEIIKGDSKGFTQPDKYAQEADQKLKQLLELNGIQISNTSGKNSDRIRLKEQERARALELLDLELKLAA